MRLQFQVQICGKQTWNQGRCDVVASVGIKLQGARNASLRLYRAAAWVLAAVLVGEALS